ncbi:MAG TPA: universal stress protein, partial [Candidatus Acidoferrales bacterium]
MNTMQAPSKVLLRNILVATDFSGASDAALRYALPIARRYDAHLYVAHVIRPDAYQLVPADAMPNVLGQARRYAEQEMANVLVSGRLRGVPHEVLLKEGEIWPALLQMLEDQRVDLVVVGTHGRTG